MWKQRRVVLGVVWALVAALLSPAPVAAQDADLARWVDPFIGTRPGDADMGTGGGAANTFPGADVPFGMVQWSPDTVTRQHGGYFYDDNRIHGFTLTHLSGAGCDTYQDIPFLPNTGDPNAVPLFSHADEQASPGYYRVKLNNEVGVELTATQRSGVGRFRYPADRPAGLTIDPGGSIMGVTDSRADIAADTISGYATSGKFCDQKNSYRVYFHALFDRPFKQVNRQNTKVAVTFDTSKSTEVTVRVGLSFVSAANAALNLVGEVGDRTFEQVAVAARARWNDHLNQIRVTGGTSDQRTIFYTALYHVLLQPNVFSDVDGSYPGFDKKIHRTDPKHPVYTNFSGWDVYRSEVQLLALLVPDAASDITRSMVLFAEQGGSWDRWTVANDYTGVMNGDPYHIIVASIYAFGAKGFDAEIALQLMVRGATQETRGYVERPGLADYLRLGYVPRAPSDTLEYTSADFAIAQLARRLGNKQVHDEFLRKAQNWRNLFHAGYLQPRNADGSFLSGFDPGKPDNYIEGNGAQYTWMVPYDFRGLIAAIGGPEAVNARLDTFFTKLNAGTKEPFAFLGNEPTLQTPWIYDYTGSPWRTQKIVAEVRDKLWKAKPEGLVGNDDLGEMSSWYVWAALGMYPEIPGRAELTLNSPQFTGVTITRPNGGTITINAPEAARHRPYVTGLRVDGQQWSKPWLPESFVKTGGVLDFALSDTPDMDWGAAPENTPPSFGPSS